MNNNSHPASGRATESFEVPVASRHARATKALPLRVAGETAHSCWGGLSSFFKDREHPRCQYGSSDRVPCLGLARLGRGAVRVRVGPVCCAFRHSLTPAPPLLRDGVLLSHRHFHKVHDA